MSTVLGKRRRAKKACVPCHQRKRRCDAEYPCNMCVAYEYECRYEDDHTTVAASNGVDTSIPIKPITRDAAPISLTGAATTSQSPNGQISAAPLMRTSISGASAAATTHTPASNYSEHEAAATGSAAAMTFPHVLSVALGSESSPPMPSFAYNFGIRPEEASRAHSLLGKLIFEEDLRAYSQVYFVALAPIGDFLDPRIYAQRCQDYYHNSNSGSCAFGAVAAGVAALGSFLSPNRHPHESELVQYAKAILEDPASTRVIEIDHIIAWGMRIFYLRATSRPNNAWIASCTALHLCEAVGLHDDESIRKMASAPGAAALGFDADRLRRIFWIPWAGHNLLSYECDRSSVYFRTLTTQPIIPIGGSLADQFVRMAQIIPGPNSPFKLDSQPPTLRDELFERLKALKKLPTTDPFLIVTKADLAFCFFRRMYQIKGGIPDDFIRIVIECGNAAIDAAAKLAQHGRLFWNVMGSVFQYSCVLLAIDTPAASSHIAATFKGLENLVEAADTGPTREALSMAQHLLGLHMAKKRKELAELEPVEASYQTSHPQLDAESMDALLNMDWGLDWDQFLFEPYGSMFNRDAPL